jgi:V/A-type H+-transporting ATPase subunit A
LPDRERIVLLGARLLRDGVLQQSALSENDAFCGPDKQHALLEMVSSVFECCERLVEHGVSAATIEEVDFGPVVRAREEVGTDDADGVRAIAARMLHELEALE